MKNFRKSIIALATAAAMLIPSVAMAATTFTTKVESSKIAATDNVYVGFYENEVLKEVVKKTVGEIAVTDANPQAEETELPATVTITDEVATEFTRADGAQIRKLVFTAKAERQITMVDIFLSYDNTKIVPLVPNSDYIDYDLTAEMLPNAYPNGMFPFSVGTYKYDKFNAFTQKNEEKTGSFTGAPGGAGYGIIGNRTGVSIDLSVAGGTFAKINNGEVVTAFYYRVLDGQTVDKDTFKIETEKGAGTLHELVQVDASNEYGIKLQSPDGDLTYSCNVGGTPVEDSIKLVTPWDAPAGPAMTTLTVNTEKEVDGYKAVMFIWDADQIAKVAPIALN